MLVDICMGKFVNSNSLLLAAAGSLRSSVIYGTQLIKENRIAKTGGKYDNVLFRELIFFWLPDLAKVQKVPRVISMT